MPDIVAREPQPRPARPIRVPATPEQPYDDQGDPVSEQRPTGGRRRRIRAGAGLLIAFIAGAVGGPLLAPVVSDLADAARSDGGDPAPPRALAAGIAPAAWTGTGTAVAPAGSCDALLTRYVELGRARVTAWGWDDGGFPAHYFGGARDGGPLPLSLNQSSAVRQTADAPRMRAATASPTGTNVQEQGVDEPDVVKTDGELLVRLDGGVLTTYDVSGRRPERLATTGLPGVRAGELLLVGDRAVVTTGDGSGSQVLVVDLADPAAPEVLDREEYDAPLVAARQHGDVVRLVLGSELPALPFVTPGPGRSHQAALARNRALVAGTDLDDWLPHRGGARTAQDRLLGCEQVGVPTIPGGLGTLAVVSLEPGAAGPDTPADRAADAVTATGLLTASDLVYASPRRLYLATPPDPWRARGSQGGSTRLHSFALDGARTSYVASGSVDGEVRERWWMDERRGVLRGAVGPTRSTGRFSSIVTLAEEGDQLVELGRLDGLGVGERIESVRWFATMAIVVTFRQVDPLYTVDLADDAAPRLRGELKMPGYSGYLHPLGTQRMIGIGQGPTDGEGTRWGGGGWGAQAALFGLDDLDDPRKISEHHYRAGTRARAETDPRQFTWLPEQRLALTVIEGGTRSGRTGWASVLDFHDGIVEERGARVEYGDDVAAVRLVPLPDGRVLLITGTDVEAFDPQAVLEP
jgi:hypothetical protein